MTVQDRTRFALASILSSWLSDGIKQERRALTDGMVAEGAQTMRALLPDGSVLGTLSLRKGTTRTAPADPDAFAAYIAENYPHGIIAERTIPAHVEPAHVSEAFAEALLKTLEVYSDGVLFDPATGEQIAAERVTGEPSVAFKPNADARELVLTAWTQGALDPMNALMEGGTE